MSGYVRELCIVHISKKRRFKKTKEHNNDEKYTHNRFTTFDLYATS